MSVLKEKRNLSEVEFINTAFNIEVLIEQISIKIPQRRQQHIYARIENLSYNILENTIKANTIFAVYKEDVFRRRQYFQAALEDLCALITQLSVAQEVFLEKLPAEKGISDATWGHLVVWVDEEKRLLIKMIESDAKRFNHLPSYTGNNLFKI